MEYPIICDNISADEEGNLLFAGQSVSSLADQYGTPLYLLDEDRIRQNCRRFRRLFAESFGDRFRLLYAGKANAFKQIYRIIGEEQMEADAVSWGEIATALAAGFPAEKIWFHGNGKTDEDIRLAMEAGIGWFIADSEEEIIAMESEAARLGIRQKLLLRVTPGIDTHTYEAVNTGKVDSKFGSAIETGQAEEILRLTLSMPHLELKGFHAHVGSQVFEEDVFDRTAVIILNFMADMRKRLGYTAEILNLGGGFGVRYVESDPQPEFERLIRSLAATVKACCAKLQIPEPLIMSEPGRSIVADAGMTVYTVGNVKRIPGYRNYVSTDGGMSDNPRYALYGSQYICLPAKGLNEPASMTCSVVGRCCESGDILLPESRLPDSVKRGDRIAVCTTGAYNYSMASNYNRLPRPPIVLLREGTSRIAVRRETAEDLFRLDES